MRTMLCLFLLIGSAAYCADLEIVNSRVFLTRTEDREVNVKKDKGWQKETREYHTYLVVFYLKNISGKELSVATRGLSISQTKEPGEICLGLSRMTVSGMSVIPPAVDFAIVNLRPGECAMVRFKDACGFKHEQITIRYDPAAVHKGHFEYWTGSVKSPAVEIEDVRGKNKEWDPRDSQWLQPGY